MLPSCLKNKWYLAQTERMFEMSEARSARQRESRSSEEAMQSLQVKGADQRSLTLDIEQTL